MQSFIIAAYLKLASPFCQETTAMKVLNLYSDLHRVELPNQFALQKLKNRLLLVLYGISRSLNITKLQRATKMISNQDPPVVTIQTGSFRCFNISFN